MDCLKTNFYKDGTMKDGLRSSCKICTNQYHYNNREKILREKKRRKVDLNFKLAHKIRCRTSISFKSQNVKKLNRTFDLLGYSHSCFKNWILYQPYGDMTLDNFGLVWEIDLCFPLSKTNPSNHIDIFKTANWINLRPMYENGNSSEGSKINHNICLLQQIKAKYFSKLNEEGLNQDLR